jgi:cysteine desulfurase/selenocysteine lyase
MSTTDPEALAKEIERLANQYFSGTPGPALNAPGEASAAPMTGQPGAPAPIAPPALMPNAMNVGAGGASPAVAMPPIPGPLHRAPLAATPAPKESDLRAVPAQAASQMGASSPALAIDGGGARSAERPESRLGGVGGRSPLTVIAGSPTPSDGAPYFLDPGGAPIGPALNLPGSMSAGDDELHRAIDGGGARSAERPESRLGGVGGRSPPTVIATPFSETGAPSDAPYFLGIAGAPSLGLDASAKPVVPSSADAFTPQVVPAESAAQRGTIFDPNLVRLEFPILRERVHGKRLVWLDNAATTQKPQSVIDRISFYYERENSNVHRGAHTLAARATDAYEAARDKVRRFLNAPSPKEIVFVRGATEGINLVAKSWGARNVGPGDEIVITWLEHHANIVPWQQLCCEKGAKLRVAPVDDTGQVKLDEFEKLLSPRTRIVSFSQVSNALGTIVPAQEMIEMAHRHGAVVLVDGAQAVSHMPVDVQALGADFYTFSGHKVFAPTGIGVVWGRKELLDTMPPWQGGGNMIQDVTFEKTTYQDAPMRFEAGTGSIGDAAGLGAAIDWVSGLGLENVSRYEHELLEYGTARLLRVPGLRMIGTAPDKAGVLSFVLDGQRTEDVGGYLDQEGIAVRSGHHCAQPILRRFGLESTVRASLAPYNTIEDIDALCDALMRLQAGRPV